MRSCPPPAMSAPGSRRRNKRLSWLRPNAAPAPFRRLCGGGPSRPPRPYQRPPTLRPWPPPWPRRARLKRRLRTWAAERDLATALLRRRRRRQRLGGRDRFGEAPPLAVEAVAAIELHWQIIDRLQGLIALDETCHGGPRLRGFEELLVAANRPPESRRRPRSGDDRETRLQRIYRRFSRRSEIGLARLQAPTLRMTPPPASTRPRSFRVRRAC